MTPSAVLEARLGRLLGIGSLLSTLVLAAGLVAFIVWPDSGLAGVLLSVGLITLMITPAARVALAFVTYAMDGDWMFALMSATVLSVLLASVFFAVG